MVAKIASALLWLFVALPLGAQQPAPQEQIDSNLSATFVAAGEVRTAENTPVPGATMRITNTQTQKAWVSWTDESGKFRFPDLPRGTYRIEASEPGFMPSLLELEVPVVPNAPIPMVLRVATLAEIASQAPGTEPAATNPAAPQNAPAANNANNANARNGRSGGRANQIPAGVQNAIREGLAAGGFQETQLTGEGAGNQENENPGASTAQQPTLTVVQPRRRRFHFRRISAARHRQSGRRVRKSRRHVRRPRRRRSRRRTGRRPRPATGATDRQQSLRRPGRWGPRPRRWFRRPRWIRRRRRTARRWRRQAGASSRESHALRIHRSL